MRRWLVSLLAFSLACQPAWAMRTSAHEAAEAPAYGRKFGGMLGRGVINVTTCFVDLLVNVVNETRIGPPLIGSLVGLGKGVGCGTLRLLSGAVDVTTFWVPGFNGFPVSDSYDDCLAVTSVQPAYAPWQAQPAISEPPMDAPAPQVSQPPVKTKEPPRYTK